MRKKTPQSVSKEQQVESNLSVNPKQLFKSMFSRSSDAILILAVQGATIVYVNKKAADLTGYAVEELLDATPFLFSDPAVHEKLKGRFEEVVEKGAVTFEYDFLLKDGSKLLIELNNTLVILNEQLFVLSVFRDLSKQKKVLEQLTLSEEKWHSLVEHAPSLILTIDLEMNVLYANKSLWFDKDEAVGRSIFEFSNPRFQEELRKNIEAVFEQGKTVNFESFGKFEGKKQYYKNQIGPIWFKGKVSGATIITSDISDQVAKSKTLEVIQQRLNQAQAIAQIGNWEWNLENGTMWWSDQLYQVFGVSKHQVSPGFEGFMEAVHKDDKAFVWAAIDRLIEDDVPMDIQFRYVSVKSHFIDIHVIAKLERNEKGQAVKMAGVVRDVTESMRVNKALAESEERLKMAQKLAKIGSWDWNVKTGEMVWSDEIYNLFEYEDKSLVLPSLDVIKEAIPGTERGEFEENLELLLEARQSLSFMHRIHAEEGGIKYVQHSLSILESNLDEVVRVLGIVQDITEQKRSDVELAVANKMLLSQTKREQRVRSKALIKGQEDERLRLSRELHDGVGQMLSATKFSFGMLARNSDVSESMLRQIIESKELIDLSINEVVRVSNNLMPSVLRDFGLVSAIQKIISIYKQETTKFKLTTGCFTGRLPEDIEIGLFRIAQEAINNAMKYAEAKTIEIELVQEKNWVEMIITDNGCGFDLQGKMRFGNGIINMRERATFLGGKFSITSKKMKGTQITVQIPIASKN